MIVSSLFTPHTTNATYAAFSPYRPFQHKHPSMVYIPTLTDVLQRYIYLAVSWIYAENCNDAASFVHISMVWTDIFRYAQHDERWFLGFGNEPA